jgi:hypothetical protein
MSVNNSVTAPDGSARLIEDGVYPRAGAQFGRGSHYRRGVAATRRIPELDLARVQRWCADRIPEHVRDQVRLEADVRGRSITILECRPHWSDAEAPWTRMKIAQLRFDDDGRTWTLYCADRNGRWHRYDDLDPSGSVSELLDEIDQDPTGIFFG